MTMSTTSSAHLELVGQHLRERGVDPLSHLDLAGEAGDAAVLADAQEGVVVVGQLAGEAARCRGLLGPEIAAGDGDEDAAPEQLEEAAAADGGGRVDTEVVEDLPCGRAHDLASFAIFSATLSMAATMRLWAPQRQRLSSMASLIRDRDGAFSSFRSP